LSIISFHSFDYTSIPNICQVLTDLIVVLGLDEVVSIALVLLDRGYFLSEVSFTRKVKLVVLSLRKLIEDLLNSYLNRVKTVFNWFTWIVGSEANAVAYDVG